VVLGLLLLETNRLVHRDAMIDLLWGDAPPRTALGLVQTHISRLRKAFGPPERVAGRGTPIDSLGGGYRLRLSSDELDLLAFRDLSERAAAAQATGNDVAAFRLYEQAVELWRGDPLADLELMVGHPGITRLRQEQSSVLLRHADVACSVGQHHVAVKRLLMVTSTDPLNEPVHARLMIALAGLGQQAAAIKVYENLRTRLNRELGLYPSEELADAHLRVLRQDVPAQRSLRLDLE
jgi:DNA-binding SARP family transcriptional activator